MIGSSGEAVNYPEINETDYKPLGMYRTTPAIYDSMSEFEDYEAQEGVGEEISVPPNPTNVPTPGYRPVRDRSSFPPDSPSPEPMELETGATYDFSQGVLRQEDPPQNPAESQMQTPT